MFDALALLEGLSVEAPVHIGQVIVKDILGLGVDFVATKSVDRFFPYERSFPLVGNSQSGYVFGSHSALGDSLLKNFQLTAPYLLGIMLHPAGIRHQAQMDTRQRRRSKTEGGKGRVAVWHGRHISYVEAVGR